MNKDIKLTEQTKAAIEAVEAAIRALPKSICMTMDSDDGIVFWKKKDRGHCQRIRGFKLVRVTSF